MKKQLLFLLLCFGFIPLAFSQTQHSEAWQLNKVSADLPFGKIHEKAPPQVADYAPMIGICDCKSLRRKPDGTWPDTTGQVWSFKYILNGTAVQDESWSENSYASSIRQYDVDSAHWVVGYHSTIGSVPTSPTPWIGNMQGDDIVLEKPQKAPNGADGINRLRFHDIREDGFNWTGAWVNDAQGIMFPFWKMWCKKRL